MEIPTFKQGQLYKRSSIHDQFGGSRQSLKRPRFFESLRSGGSSVLRHAPNFVERNEQETV